MQLRDFCDAFCSVFYTVIRDASRFGTRNLKSTGGFSLFDTCCDLWGLKTVKVSMVVFQFQSVAMLLTIYLIITIKISLSKKE